MTSEERLRLIVTKIESSLLSTKEKYQLYAAIRATLQTVVSPAVARHLSAEKVVELEKDLEAITPDKYIDLISTAYLKPEFYHDLEELFSVALQSVEITLKEHHVIV